MTGQIDRRRLVRPVVAVGHGRTRVRISAIRYVSVEQRLVLVFVVGAVLVFLGCMHMKQRRCKQSDQESSTKHRHHRANSSHKAGCYLTRTSEANGTCTRQISQVVDNAS